MTLEWLMRSPWSAKSQQPFPQELLLLHISLSFCLSNWLFESKWPRGCLLSFCFLTWIWHGAVLASETCYDHRKGAVLSQGSHHHLDQCKGGAGICKWQHYWLQLGILLLTVTYLKNESIAVDDNAEVFLLFIEVIFLLTLIISLPLPIYPIWSEVICLIVCAIINIRSMILLYAVCEKFRKHWS